MSDECVREVMRGELCGGDGVMASRIFWAPRMSNSRELPYAGGNCWSDGLELLHGVDA